MTDVPKTRTRRTLEQRLADLDDKRARLRASASKQARARKTRGRVLLAVTLERRTEKVRPKQDLYSTLRTMAREELSPADFEAFDKYWSDMGFPAD